MKGMVFKQFPLGWGILRPKEVPFSGLRYIFEREGISLVIKYIKGQGNLSFESVKRGLQMHFTVVKKKNGENFCLCDLLKF